MEALELKVDKARIMKFAVDNTTRLPTKDFTDYTFYAMRAASEAQALRQKAVGRGDEVERKIKEGRLKKDNPLGFYALMTESALIKFSNSLGYLVSAISLEGIASDKDIIIRAANQRLSRTLGVQTDAGINTAGMDDKEKMSAHLDLHYQCLQDMVNLYNEGIKLHVKDPRLKEGYTAMLGYIQKEIGHANRVLAPRTSGFWLFKK